MTLSSVFLRLRSSYPLQHPEIFVSNTSDLFRSMISSNETGSIARINDISTKSLFN